MQAGRADVGRAVVARVRRAAAADGAGESGLAALLWTHALSSAGDALVTVALASTVFFSVPLGQARGRVALYLVLTLLPFSLLVPVAGPVLDRFRHGRRNVLAATAAGRGLVAWSMATLTASLGLYPAALGVLVLSRSYGVARSAATPRVTPPGLSLVAANARLNVASIVSAGVAAAVGGGVLKTLGSGWVLRLATLVLLVAAVCAVRLPAHVDEAREARARTRAPRFRLLAEPVLVRPLVTAAALRALAGMLTIFLAFLLKGTGASALEVSTVLGAAVGGQLVGTALASRLPERVTARLTLASLAVPAVACTVAAVLGGPLLQALAAGLSGLSYSLSKFALDAVIQTRVPAASTSGAFARSETGLQLSWALGGGLGLAVPTVQAAGFGLAAALPVAGAVLAVRLRRAADARAAATSRDGGAESVMPDVDLPLGGGGGSPLGADRGSGAGEEPWGGGDGWGGGGWPRDDEPSRDGDGSRGAVRSRHDEPSLEESDRWPTERLRGRLPLSDDPPAVPRLWRAGEAGGDGSGPGGGPTPWRVVADPASDGSGGDGGTSALPYGPGRGDGSVADHEPPQPWWLDP